MAELRTVVIDSELTAEKIRELAKHGILGVRMEAEETRVYVRSSVGVYKPTLNCGPLMDALDEVGCSIYYGRRVPQTRGMAKVKRDNDLANTTALCDAYGKDKEIDMIYVDKDLVPTVRTVIPVRSSVDYRNCFEAQCKLRGEARTFNKAGVVKILAVRNAVI
jgi:hypothetical protein